MNIWRRGPLDKNPYRRTAFRVARVQREIVQHRRLVQLIGQTKLIAQDPRAHLIGGEAVSLAEINAAVQVLLDAKLRIAEELLEHATERPPMDALRKLAREASEALLYESKEMATSNYDGLQIWVQDLVQQYLETTLPASPSFGALELTLVPPFGRAGE